jgi:phosphoglycolate phosphatase-like HAD superfamily hydrolase
MKVGKEGVIPFDVDGVLNRGSTPLYIRGIETVLETCDIKIDPVVLKSEVLERWGRPPKRILMSLIDFASENIGSAPDRNDMKKIGQTKRFAAETYDTFMVTDFIDGIGVVEGAAETLEELHERYELGLNTSADRRILFEYMLPKLGIDPDLFNEELVWTADDLDEHQEKPAPYVLNQILRSSGFDTDQAVMVGDSATDVLSAHFAGVEPIVPLTGNLTEDEARELGVEYVIEDITRIHEVLPRAFGRQAFSLAGLARPSA